MSKHTPGPWTAQEETYQSDHIKVIHHSNNPGAASQTIAKVTCRMCWSAEQKANASLIAAAPQLLSALELLFGADMEYCMMGDGKQDQIDAIAAARAAIAKATGESA